MSISRDSSNFLAIFLTVYESLKGDGRRNSGFQGKGAISQTSAQKLKHAPASPPASLGICRSSFGAGVPAEAEWSWIRHVFDGGVTSSSCCHSFRFIFWLRQSTLLLRTQYDPPGSVLRHSSAFFFHPPSTTPLFSLLLYYLSILDRGSSGSPQAPYPNKNLGNPHCGFLLLLISSV